jgi:3-hydroxyacyl-CoA dehydrogenase
MIDAADAGVIGIVGAGSKGRELAVCALLAGYRVILEDMSSARLTEAKAHISAELRVAIAGELSAQSIDDIFANYSTFQTVDEIARHADLLIEAAPEDAELQLEIFTIFDKFAKPRAVLASTAHSVSISDLAEMTNCPERCVGLRFFGTAARGRQVHILSAPKTDQHTLQICSNFVHRIGFESKIVPEAGYSAASAKTTGQP